MITASSNIIYAIVLSSIFVASILGFVIASYIRLSNKYVDLKNKMHKEDLNRKKITNEILHKSYREAQDVVLEAKRKSLELIRDATFFTKNQEESFNRSFEQITNQQLDIYQSTLNDIKEDTALLLGKILLESKNHKDEQIKLLIDNLRIEIEETTNNYNKEIAKLTLNLKNSLDSEHEVIQKELEQYRNMMISRLDNKVVDIVKEVVTEIFSVGLSLSDREEMILQSLREAKKKFGLDEAPNTEIKTEDEKS